MAAPTQPQPQSVVASAPEAGTLPDLPVASDVHDAGATPNDDVARGGVENPNPMNVPKGVDADDVREAVFRHMISGHNASGQGVGAGVFCLEVDGQHDPTPGFLARFNDLKKPIVAISDCSLSADQGVVDKRTHKRGLSFRVETITFKDAHHAKAIGGYYEAGLSGSGNVYSLERKANVWVVVKDEMMWIS